MRRDKRSMLAGFMDWLLGPEEEPPVMKTFALKLIKELTEAVRSCPCRETKCSTCRANLDRIDSIVDRELKNG